MLLVATLSDQIALSFLLKGDMYGVRGLNFGLDGLADLVRDRGPGGSTSVRCIRPPAVDHCGRPPGSEPAGVEPPGRRGAPGPAGYRQRLAAGIRMLRATSCGGAATALAARIRGVPSPSQGSWSGVTS